jgi:hypothetical protein
MARYSITLSACPMSVFIEAKRLGGPKINPQLEFCCPLNREFG